MRPPLHFVHALVEPTRRRVVVAVLLAAALIFALYVPLLNVPVVLVLWPLWGVPGFGETGAHVEWSFFGPLPRSATAFAAIFSYLFVVSYFLAARARHKKRAAKSHPDGL